MHGCEVNQCCVWIWLNHSFPCITFHLDPVPWADQLHSFEHLQNCENREEWPKGGTAYSKCCCQREFTLNYSQHSPSSGFLSTDCWYHFLGIVFCDLATPGKLGIKSLRSLQKFISISPEFQFYVFDLNIPKTRNN